MLSVQTFVDKNRLPHLLFHGPPGTGKTSTIVTVAKTIFGKSYKSMVLELNASDDRGINIVREEIKSFVSALPVFQTSLLKMVILDEADNMTSAAQFALRRLIEQFSRNSRFCLVCNYVSRVIPALQSRCTKFRFGPLSDKDVVDRVEGIAKAESVNMAEGAMEALLKIGQGDMRRILNVLQATSLAFDVVDERAIYLTTGTPLTTDIDGFFTSLLTKPFKVTVQEAHVMRMTKGYALADLIAGLYHHMQNWEFPPGVQNEIMARLADIEYRCANGANEQIQLASLIALFIQARHVCQQLLENK
eukprot:GHVL01007484.1.p1 GENE.GHVL01007484.1~~GHVL01007484.1.p1  ORF type:complete len:304 (+),score=59.38 GHVL01007484.1:206-1117(+)